MWTFAVQASFDVGELYAAMELLEESPEAMARSRASIGGRSLASWERLNGATWRCPHYQWLIQNRQFDAALLVVFTESSSRHLSADGAKRMLERHPDDLRVRLSEARVLMSDRQAADAQSVLHEILDRHPRFSPAHAMLGQAMVDGQQWEALEAWNEMAPALCTKHLDYWLTLGDWASHAGKEESAVRAYWQATLLAPNRSVPWDRLAKAMRKVPANKIPDKKMYLAAIERRLRDLLELSQRYYRFSASHLESQRLATHVAESLLKLGQYWEAEAWAAVATTLTKDPSDDLLPLRQAVIEKIKQDPSWLASKGFPERTLDLSPWKVPQISTQKISAQGKPPRVNLEPQLVSTDHLKLVEESVAWGLAEVGAGNDPSDPRLAPLIRTTGAGGGTIDYDLDGLADLLLAGAAGEMQAMDSHPHQLLRHLGDRFVSVGEIAGVADAGFGQGVCVGDFDEDGFPDLFFANLGRNRLLRNLGDGTFADHSDHLGDGQAIQWTTSGAMVDVNHDGITDLVTTSYCKLTEGIDKPCPSASGVSGACHPLRFPADQDQFLAGVGDGSFQDVTHEWQVPSSPGRGLGILAGSFNGKNLAVYVANDMTANHYYSRENQPGDQEQESAVMQAVMQESAAARGLAVDARTTTQASMGIASGDFDRDGDLDLYVTGFAKEHNIYYEQVSEGYWKDETAKVNLAIPTLMTVGFGTEAIDLDSDGLKELIVTNGHIGDFGDKNVPYAQPLQLFRRSSGGGFAKVNFDHWGDYFSRPHVGRALWTLDVNQDGRNDVAITHAKESLRLLVNRSHDDHHRIGFKLVGTQASRDAIGAVVRFKCDEQSYTEFLLAGSGFMCSNEQVIRTGIGKSNHAEQVTVTWQNGSMDEIGTLDADAEYLIIQGQAGTHRLRRYLRKKL